jgi:L-aspartate oxidase
MAQECELESQELKKTGTEGKPNGLVAPPAKAAEEFIREVQQIMWRDVGIVRSGKSLKQAMEQLEMLRERLPKETSRRAYEANNIWQTGALITRSAMARLESRGAHYRTDYPEHDDVKFKKHSIVAGPKVRFE